MILRLSAKIVSMKRLIRHLRGLWPLVFCACQPEGAPERWDHLDGLEALKIKDAETIVIRRDRSHLLGLSGTEMEVLSVGGRFKLSDADHISRDYRFVSTDGPRVLIEEHDQSHLPGEAPRDQRRNLLVESFGPWVDTAEDAVSVAWRHATEKSDGLFSQPHTVSVKRQAATGHWVVHLLNAKPEPGKLGAMYWYIVVDKTTGAILSSGMGGGS